MSDKLRNVPREETLRDPAGLGSTTLLESHNIPCIKVLKTAAGVKPTASTQSFLNHFGYWAQSEEGRETMNSLSVPKDCL